MRKHPKEAFTEWLDDDKEETMCDVIGEDWDSLVDWSRLAFEAGWNAALANLTTQDIKV